MIRRASPQDIDGIVKLILEAREESDTYINKPYSRLRLDAMLHNLLDDLKSVILVDDGVDMVLAASVTPDWKGLGFIAWTHLIYAREGVNGRPLIRAFREWGKGWGGVNKLGISTSFGGPRGEKTEKFLKLIGFKEVGKQLIEEL